MLNKAPGSIVGAAKRKAILQAARHLGYRPNRSARTFSTGRLNCIGLAIGPRMFVRWRHRATASLIMEMVQGVMERLAELNHTVMLVVVPVAKAVIRGRTAFEGNLQIADMYESTPDDIRAQVEALIHHCFDDRRGLSICPTASPYIRQAGAKCFPQYKAMVDTVLEWQE